MALDPNNQSVLGVVQTYDSGGQLAVPGVVVGNEDINAGLAPDNDPADYGVDIFANVANGTGPQVDGEGIGALVDLDTNTENGGLSGGLAAVDDSDAGYGGDLAVLGNAGQTADDSLLAVHLSGVGDHAVDGLGGAADNTAENMLGVSPFDDVGGVSVLDLDHS